jgi:hypothetical protein
MKKLKNQKVTSGNIFYNIKMISSSFDMIMNHYFIDAFAIKGKILLAFDNRFYEQFAAQISTYVVNIKHQFSSYIFLLNKIYNKLHF